MEYVVIIVRFVNIQQKDVPLPMQVLHIIVANYLRKSININKTVRHYCLIGT